MTVNIHEISKNYPVTLVGSSNSIIERIGKVGEWKQNCLYWSKNAANLAKVTSGIVLCQPEHFEEINPSQGVNYLLCSNPRLFFAKIVHHFFPIDPNENFDNQITEFRKRSDIKIGENVFIGKNVTIGSGTIILHNVVIHSNTVIGENCIISDHASLGTEGLGLEMDPETKSYIKFPQIGGVILHDNVEIGPNSTVRRSALGNTIIHQGTKIGSLCNIGHNCIIGANCILTCNVIISGSSIIGEKNFLGVGTLLKHGIKTGCNVTTGIGSVVVKNIPDNETWIGNPAQNLNF